VTLLTALEPQVQRSLDDAVRDIAWSPTGGVLALGADGKALLAADGQLIGPIGPDPIGCCWINDHRVAVVDGMVGLAVAGCGSIDLAPIDGALTVQAPLQHGGSSASAGYCVVAGAGGLNVVHPERSSVADPSRIRTGPLRVVAQIDGPMWLGGGADGLVVVDVDLGCVEQRIHLPGVVSLAVAPEVGYVAASDVTGSLHILELSDLEHGIELTGYPDAVQHLGIAPLGEFVVACADDELTWWGIDESGGVTGAPESSIGHGTAIACCAVGPTGYVATGDADGLVRLWSPELRDVAVSALQLSGEVTVLEWSPDGGCLAIGTAAGELVVADITAGELL